MRGLSTSVLFAISFIILISIPVAATPEMYSMALISREYVPSTSQVTRNVDFTLGKSFNVDNSISHPDFTERSAGSIVDQVGDFLPNGLQRVTDVDIYYTDVSISITRLHVIEDQELIGPGEIFFEFVLNRDQVSHSYRDDNDGNYYVTDDGTYLDVDIFLADYLYSMNGSYSIEIHGKESDVLGDAYLGGALLFYDLTGCTSVSASGWLPLNYYPPIGGINPLQIEVYLELNFTNIEVLSYPTDFPTTYDGSWLISAVYFPKVHYFEMGAPPPHIKNVYEQVYYGYDPSIGANAYLVYYMFFWDFEMEDIVNLGHYYDYEPLLMYVQEIGLEPYRIAYRNKGAIDAALPSKLIIQDDSVGPQSGSFVAEVSTPLMPLLGNQSTQNYEYKGIYFNTPAHHYETDHGLTPLMTVPHMTINDAFHQMEVGVPLLSSEADLTPLQDYLIPMTNEVIREGYGRLDEAFNSDINVYEFQNFWGGDYHVPYNMSLTIDMLHNPFEFPYIVDCWEDIVHYTEAKEEYKANGFYYDIDLDLSFSVPATVTFDIPTQVTRGQTYDIGIDLALDPEDITISFAYDIYLEYVLHWWFIGFEESVTYSGQCDFAVNLNEISEFVSFIGLSSEDLTGDYQGGWLTVTDFSTSTDLLSTMLDCSVEIHLLRILTDLLGFTGVGKLIEILKIFLSDVDLIASPTISGFVTGELSAENSAISLDTSGLTFDEGSTHKSVQMTVLGGEPQTGIKISNMQYHIEFSTDWDLEIDFTEPLNYFVQDVTFPIGTFPTITISSDEHDITADTTTGYDQFVSLSVVEPQLQEDPFAMLLLLGGGAAAVVAIALIVVIVRRRA